MGFFFWWIVEIAVITVLIIPISKVAFLFLIATPTPCSGGANSYINRPICLFDFLAQNITFASMCVILREKQSDNINIWMRGK